MAAGFLMRLRPGWDVHSAGTYPASQVHPIAVKVMAELGLDLSACRPKGVAEFLDIFFDYVITVCDNASETCPVFNGEVKYRLHMGFNDPAEAVGAEEEVMEVFRRVRDEIRERFERFVEAVDGAARD